VANIISVTCGITNNYILNARFNFKTGSLRLKQYLKFYGVGVLGLGLSTGMIWVLTSVLGYDPIVSKLITVVFVTITQYVLNRSFTFGVRKEADEHE
jgi:putative flippase GtrA